jgi:Zn-dependent protease with chaperone function
MTSTREPARRPTGSSAKFSARPAAPVAAQTLLALPWFAVSLVIVSIIGTVPGYPWGWLVIAIWLASGTVVLLPGFERIMARVVFRVREPSGVERERLMLTWRPVAHVAGVGESAYGIWVRRSAEPVTSAMPGHALVVTDWAARMLQPRQLEAVLARELGRHRLGSRWVDLLAYWYSLPARLVCGAVAGLVRGIGAVRRALPFLGWLVAGFLVMCWLGMILGSLIRNDGSITLVWLITPVVAPALLAWCSRYVEKRADRGTETLGYGAALAGVFHAWLGDVAPPAVGRGRLLDAQPSVPSRLRCLDRFLSRRRPG